MGCKIRSAGADAVIRDMLQYLGADGGEQGLVLETAERTAPGLSVKKADGVLRIAYSEKAYLFRGLGLAVEHGDEETLDIEQVSCFEGNGVMLDCSRNAVPRVETVKDMVRQLALMGHNTLLLYTEDTYEIEGEPYFGYMRGRYSLDELRELDAFAYERGVEMIPCIQTLAHLNAALRWQAYYDVKDIDDILVAEYEPTYALVEKMIAACRAAFRTHRIHIGMDEAGHLGRGKYKDIHGDTPSIDIMCRHLERVLALCEQYDFRPMMWNDMFFTLAGASYNPQAGVDPSLLERVPPQISMVYWDYYGTDQETYDQNTQKQMGFPNELIFAGGAWKWSGHVPCMYHSLQVSRLALDSCRRYGVKRVFTTAWGDNGSEASFMTILPVVQLFAELGFDPAIRDEALASRFAVCTGGCMADFAKLDTPNFVEGPIGPTYNPSKYLLYQDPLAGLFDKHADKSYDAFYAKTAAELAEAGARAGRYGYVFDTLAALCDVLALKASVGIRLKEAYDAGDKAELRRLADEVLPAIAERTEHMRDCLETQWMKENKGFGFEVQDVRLAGVASRARSAARRVNAYLAGDVAAIEELEAERQYFDLADYSRCRVANPATWSSIFTGCVTG